jgi:hypothetical protein
LWESDIGAFFVRAAIDHLAKSSAGYFPEMSLVIFARNQRRCRIAGLRFGPGGAETGY